MLNVGNSWFIATTLIFQLTIGTHAAVDPTFNKEQMGLRLKLACPIQPTDAMAKKFYECLYKNGLPYQVEKVLCPCKGDFGFDTCTIPGSWKAMCNPTSKLNSVMDGDKIKDCILKNMLEQSTEKDVMIMCQNAMKAVQKCADELKLEAAKAGAGKAINGDQTTSPGGGKPTTKKPNNNNNNNNNNKGKKPSQPEMAAMGAIARAKG